MKLQDGERAKAPWHDAPTCPHCEGTFVTPARFSPHASRFDAATEMWCPCCGAFWATDDVEMIAKAFYSRGTWDGHEWDRR
jgi:hypothetical protein